MIMIDDEKMKVRMKVTLWPTKCATLAANGEEERGWRTEGET